MSKRFTINTLDGSIDLRDNGRVMTYGETVDRLNYQHETIERYQHIIKTSIETERTALGQSVLKQLADALDIEI